MPLPEAGFAGRVPKSNKYLMDQKMTTEPSGCIIPVGGAEDKAAEHESFFKVGVLKHILDRMPDNTEPQICVVTSAAADPADAFAGYKEGFTKLGCTHVRHLEVRSPADAASDETLQALAACSCVMLTGGDQMRLRKILADTPALDLIRTRYKDDKLVIAGTSAGAMVMSTMTIYEGREECSDRKGEVEIASGFGFLEHMILDTHVDKRGRFSRLAQAVATLPGSLGIGLDEDTGLVITRGREATVIGSGSIILIDGRSMTYTNIPALAAGQPITIENLCVHILAAGDRYDLKDRTILK
jgi:cyanophycinase